MKARLVMLWLRSRGATHRYLLCSTEERPQRGHTTFDYLAFFGFGSGDFHSVTPSAYKGTKVKVVPCPGDGEIALAYMSSMLQKPTDGFSGFFTDNGKDFFELRLDPEGMDMFHLPELDWRYYTAIGGTRDIAIDHVKTLNRKHVLFETAEEQSNLLNRYAELIDTV